MGNQKPTIWITFPVYNTGRLLHDFLAELKTVSTILRSEYKSVILVAVDDGSTDSNTVDILKDSPDVHVIRHDENKGVVAGLLTALQYVGAHCSPEDCMAWLDSDGEHDPLHLVHLVRMMKNKSVDMALAQLLFREEHMGEIDRKSQEFMGAVEGKLLLGHYFFQHCPGCWIVRAEYIVSGAENLKAYMDFYKKETGMAPRWGEDMTFLAIVKNLGGQINDDLCSASHMPAPNRSLEKIIDQLYHAVIHLRLYQGFFNSWG